MKSELHLDEQEQQEGIQRLKEELLSLLQWMDHLLLQQGPKVESEYWSLFGSLEKDLHQSYFDYQRLRRKREILVTQLQKGEAMDRSSVERQLDMEFKRYVEQLEELERLYQKSLVRMNAASTLSNEKNKKLKDLYREFVKSLHPDLHGELSEEENDLWLQAQQAYETGDLDFMQMLRALLVPRREMGDDQVFLEKKIAFLKAKIKTILLQPPLSLQVYLKQGKKEKRRESLEDLISQYTIAIKGLEEEVSLLSVEQGTLH